MYKCKEANWNDVQAVLPLDRHICSSIHLYNMQYLEYAVQLWDPHVKRDIQLLESVQKFACKVCLKCWDMDYNNMLHCLDLPLLRVRRQHLKLITMYNIINGNTVFPAGIFNLQSLRHSSFIFHRPCCRTNYFYFSYVPSVIAVWNTLPVDI